MQCFTPQNTPVEIIGADWVHPKLAGMVTKMITLENAEDNRPCNYHPLKRVLFDASGNPAGKNGFFVNGDITVNLRECFKTGTELVDNREDAGILGMAWHVIIHTVFHELFHVWVSSAPELKFDDHELEEEEADAFAIRQTILFGMKYDTEMPPWKEMHLFTELFEEVMEAEFEKDPESNWLKTQRRFANEGIIFVTREGAELTTFRDYMRVISGWPTRNNDRWEEPTLVTWKNIPENLTPDAPKPPAEKVAAAGASPVPPPPPEPPEPQVAVPPPPPSAPTASVPPPPAANAAEEPVYTEDYPPQPWDGELYSGDEVVHAYQPVRAPQERELEQHNVSLADIVTCMQAVYTRLAYTMFDKCQFNGGGAFGNPAGVLDPVSIADIPHATEIIHSCETVNQFGQPTRMDCNGVVKGTIFTKKQLPAYKLFLNINGKVHKRVVVPQNPNTNSVSAKKARAGAKIVWIINADLTNAQVNALRSQGKRASKFIAKVENGQYTALK